MALENLAEDVEPGGGIDITDDNRLAYIIGLIYGDGSLSKQERTGNYKVVLANNSSRLVEEYRSIMGQLGYNTHQRVQEYEDDNHNPTTYVTTDSKELFKYIQSVISSADRVEEELQTDEHRRLFTRGFYEAEGSFEWDSYRIRISQKDQNILELVSRYINDAGIETRWEHYGPYSNLVVGGRSRMEKFIDWTDPCIKRRCKDG